MRVSTGDPQRLLSIISSLFNFIMLSVDAGEDLGGSKRHQLGRIVL